VTSAEPDFQKPEGLPGIPVLDQNALGHIMEVGDGEAELLKELLGMFERDQPPRLDNLMAAINSGDMKTIRDIAHAIRGSAGTMGAARLRAAAGILEAYGLGHPVAEPPDGLFKLLVGAYDEARQALTKYLEKHQVG